jgi:hypothetical protein|nr:MAG TPA: tail protein [Caudoviricetes sp.]
MYAGYVDGRLLFAAGMPGYEIVDGTISEAVGSASSATIKLPPSNIMRDVPIKRASVISIRKDGAEVFRGSVVDTTTDLRGMRTYSIDSAMMWLADICKPPHTINAMAVSTYLGALVTQYNAGCLAGKQVKLGEVGASLPSITLAASEYKSMLDLAKEAASISGGELRIRYADGSVYLDCLASYDHRCAQTVELRKNLLGLTDEIDGADLITRVYPVGKDGLTIEDVNGGQVYLVNAAAEGIYGRIDGTLRADTDDASALKATAASYLAQHSGLSRGIQVTAADLSAQDIMIESFAIGDSVRVVSPPHGIDTIMQVSKLDTSLVGSKSSMTIGWGKKSLTGSVSSSGIRSTSTSSGGSSSADTIIDQGTTGKWTWRKWASGIAEMWALFDIGELAMTSQTWGALYTASWMGLAANKAARAYPFAFVANPAVSATPTVGSGNIWLATNTENDIGTRLTHAPAYQCVRASDAVVNAPQVSYYVVGRYK